MTDINCPECGMYKMIAYLKHYRNDPGVYCTKCGKHFSEDDFRALERQQTAHRKT